MTEGRTVRPWALMFLVSLGLNLFLGGMLAGRWWTRHRGREGPAPFGMLGPEMQPVAHRVWAGRRGQVEERMRVARTARDAAAEALSAEPFDPKRATDALAALRAATGGVRETTDEALVEIAGSLSPEQRKKFAHAVGSGVGPGGRAGSKRGGMMPDGLGYPHEPRPSAAPSESVPLH